MQMEIFPLHLCRHVLKFILGRPINWFDLAFYDPVLFESMRTLVFNEGPTRPEQINNLYLTFEVAVPEQEVRFNFLLQFRNAVLGTYGGFTRRRDRNAEKMECNFSKGQVDKVNRIID